MDSSGLPKTLFAFGINHKTAPVEVREKVYLRDEEVRVLTERLRRTLSECVVLSTCNRTEIYAVTEEASIDLGYYRDLLIDIKNAHDVVTEEHFFAFISCPASQQLFKVATSIDSKIIGDSQILRQLRCAYSTALEHGHTGKILNQLMQRALKLGKRTYTETSIHAAASSVSLAAVELAVETLGSLEGRSVLVIGAGETAMLAAEALVSKRAGKILISNRTRTHAEEALASLKKFLSFESEVIDFDRFKSRLGDVDIIISSTGSDEPVLHRRDFAGVDRKVLAIDIAVPRDIDESVNELPNVTVKNIDDLRSVVNENLAKRLADLPKANEMITAEMIDFLRWYYLLPILPAYGKTGARPSQGQAREIVRIKAFLDQHSNEIHRFARGAGTDFAGDLHSHLALVKRLKMLKREALGVA